ncbi:MULTISPECIES: hypothetical protein [Erysipelotrichaceae]|uniref:hypothetical protein n=1 Tax=Erysipelotrichaceae TaxID=128827 RepID=UPI000E54CB3B|nr:hypothetical protein [Amedibacterium intestinale]RHO21333.1 hypothetical protein DW220_07345 [Eubacterium sp. AM18-26]RHO25532.1 hypothetical protein DW212_07325 [Eubacterium sp. AM18-10LB-B]
MEDKKYAFYSTENIRKKLESGTIENMHIAEISQKQGEDISHHGTPMYDIETILTDIQTGKQYHHSHYDEHHMNKIDFIGFDEVNASMQKLKTQTDRKIEELQNEIQRLEKQKEAYMAVEKTLNEKMDSLLHSGGLIKNEPTSEKTHVLYAKFNARQIRQHFDHPSKVDRDGKPLKMVNIMIPSKDFRFFRFGKDSHGFERDDIQAYWTSIKALVRTDQDKDGNAKKNGKRYIYLNKNTEDPVYKICFEPQKDENGAFVEPEPVYLNAKQLSQIYNEQYLIGKERRKERDPNKMLEENKEQKKESRKQSVGKER